jgi:Predicted transcriptional regulator
MWIKEPHLSSLDTDIDDLLVLTTDIVSSYVSNNVVPAADLPSLIQTVHGSLTGLGIKAEEVKTEAPEPAVPIKKSIKPDMITCLECGKGFKSLRRHLNSHHDQSPDEYRARWSLPADYPMVAPQYSEARSSLAKRMGLGQRRTKVGKKRKGA